MRRNPLEPEIRRYHPNDPLCPDPDDKKRREAAAERLDDLRVELERTRRVNEEGATCN